VLTLTRKTDYALVALAELAAANGASLSARELATRTALPQPILRNLLKDLTASGILASVKGAAGGYRLELAPAAISAMAVIEAVDRPVQLARCCGGDDEHEEPGAGLCTCPHERRCRIRTAIKHLQEQMLDLLRHTTLHDLMRDSIPNRAEARRTGATAPISLSVSPRRSVAGIPESTR